jgi:hypothetical protein
VPRTGGLSMKPHTLTVALPALALVVLTGLSGLGCAAEPDAPSAPPAPEVKHVASSLERKLPSPIAVPADTAIGVTIDAIVELHATAVAREPVLNLGANGKSCTIVRYDDDMGIELMRRERCSRSTDTLYAGAFVYVDQDGNGTIDHLSELGAGTYELWDDDGDGKVDRMVEGAERIETPIALTDFAPDVTIMGNGKIASRERQDKDHDGTFDVESVTATTSFQIAAH